MVTDQHRMTDKLIKHDTLSLVRLHQGTTTGTERSSDLGGRREEKARSEHVVAEHSMPVWQPLGMTDHPESSGAWMEPVEWTTRQIGGVDMRHG